MKATKGLPVCSFCHPEIPADYDPSKELWEDLDDTYFVVTRCKKCNRVVLINK